MHNLMLGMATTLLTIYLIPILVHGLFSRIFAIKPPGDVAPARFLLSILISKAGTALAITVLYPHAIGMFANSWLWYALVWWVFFVTGEIGQWIGRTSSTKEAIAGMISETIYVPLSVYWLSLMLR